ncbi:MAG: hypothetical protein JWN44_2408 [Myxococcales bacterium]|nr:hypothetical protein [Myxococcales bacterium]
MLRAVAVTLVLSLATGARAQSDVPAAAPPPPAASAPAEQQPPEPPKPAEQKAPEPPKPAEQKAPEPAKLPSSGIPTVPDVPDEPLPDWHPPTVLHRGAQFLEVSPQVASAQRIRQVGLWISSIGWAQLLAAGILYGWAVNLNDDVGHPHADGSGMANSSGQITQTQVFDPRLEDERNRVQNASIGLISIGTTMAVTGFVIYTIGQARITSWHKQHPKDPLPPLSGF